MNCGVYIHIPFCHSRCNYCHFISMDFRGAETRRYAAAVKREVADFPDSGIADSLYFGGGTPSLLADCIPGLIGTVREKFRFTDDCEISLEANPGTISARRLHLLRSAGVNRVSLGAQSFADAELTAIGRIHDSETILKSVAQLRAEGFSNINLDVMLGLPGQTEKSWTHNLEMVARLSVPHVSVYMLDLDDRCELHSLVESGSVKLPDDDLVSDLYLETIESLLRHGYLQYEISNFALPGFFCRHNLKYWRREPVYGFGLGSHSFDGHARYSNCPELGAYLEAVESGRSPVTWYEPVSAEQSLAETLFLGLRLTQGIDWGQLLDACGARRLARYEEALREIAAKGLAEWDGESVRLTASGMLVSNEIFQCFV
ncbi:MAG: radical SAM family heme chaperone HemW [Acidobacteria bacterium]|nr:radical SAM family heme chaperone HemW [Acidobacteriota bacterium]